MGDHLKISKKNLEKVLDFFTLRNIVILFNVKKTVFTILK